MCPFLLHPNDSLINFIDLIKSYCFLSHIKIPTSARIWKYSCIIILLQNCIIIWCNIQLSVDPLHTPLLRNVWCANHFITFLALPIKLECEKVKLKFRDYSEGCINRMIDWLHNFALFFPLLTLNHVYKHKFNFFVNQTSRIYETNCPIKTIVIYCKKLF